MSDVLGLSRPSNRRRWISIALIALTFLVLVGACTALWFAWDRKGPIEARGGLPFPGRLELDVPSFRQSDDRWRKDQLGATDGTLGSEGCAVSSAAMVLASYGIDTDPKRLNEFLQEKEGYTPDGWIYWEKAAEFAPDKVKHVYEDDPSYRLIDMNLLGGNPVIVRLRTKNDTTHFVVVAGKHGFDYLAQDPGAGAAKGIYPLREFGSKIEALRFYAQLQ